MSWTAPPAFVCLFEKHIPDLICHSYNFDHVQRILVGDDPAEAQENNAAVDLHYKCIVQAVFVRVRLQVFQPLRSRLVNALQSLNA